MGRVGNLLDDDDGSRHSPAANGALLSPSGSGTPYPALSKRGLKPDTLRRYGYFLSWYGGSIVHVAPYYDQAGELALQKLRFPDKSSFPQLKRASPPCPPISECKLFGQQVYGDKHDKRVVVTEGEIDAMSVAQETGFTFPVVSVSAGAAGAAKSIKANWLWLDRFAEIVLWFDDDEPGQAALAECAQLFAVGKVKVAKMQGCKDPSDAIQQGKPGDIKSAVYAATAWSPPGIVNAADSPDDVCSLRPDDAHAWAYPWPWEFVHDALGPMLPGQVCYHVAGTGIGKSTAIAEIAYSLVNEHKCKVALMCFEDTRRDIKLRILTIKANQKLDSNPLPDEEMRKLHAQVFGSRGYELFDPETAEWSVSAILGYVRYCAKALDCRVVFIDPLTFIAAGLSLQDDERRALDKASRDLAALAKELGIMLHIAHHLTDPRVGEGHTEGAASHLNQVRGSGGIANFATFVIGHERNQQAEGSLFLLTQIRSLKNRPRSVTGPLGVLRYDMITGRLLPTKEEFPSPTKAKGSKDAPFPANHDY